MDTDELMLANLEELYNAVNQDNFNLVTEVLNKIPLEQLNDKFLRMIAGIMVIATETRNYQSLKAILEFNNNSTLKISDEHMLAIMDLFGTVTNSEDKETAHTISRILN